MKPTIGHSKLVMLFLASRPKFLLASVSPVLVGSMLGFSVTGAFEPMLFVLALLAIIALHAGANMANDYFDHISRNDWVNENLTPFSGGSRYIQEGILSPGVILSSALVALGAGSAIGLVIVFMTRSLFILVLGIIGLLGGFFYTAPPVKLGYRSVGELTIAFLFGILPVFGAYHLQTGTVEMVPILPGIVIGALIFLVILINDFPDADADAAVGKKTFVVRFGVPVCIWIYRGALIGSFVAAAIMLACRLMFFAGLLYFIALPIAALLIKFVNKKDLTTPGLYRANQITILLHSVGTAALSIGFIIPALRNTTM